MVFTEKQNGRVKISCYYLWEAYMKKILETERLYLREMSMDDFDALYAVLSDREIMQHYPYTFDEERVRGWIERNMNRYKDNGFGLWAVCLKETGEMIGDCILRSILTANTLTKVLLRPRNPSACTFARNIRTKQTALHTCP